jgi:hypothetical protein
MKTLEDVEALLHQARAHRPGLLADELARWRQTSTVVLPDDVVELLTSTNGAGGPQGGICSLREIGEYLGEETVWRERRWIPVLKDGCGNVHLSIPLGSRRVMVFVEAFEDKTRPRYLEASSITHGIACLLERELKLRDDQWPFVKERLEREDPEIIALAHQFHLPLPWSDTDPKERARLRRRR